MGTSMLQRRRPTSQLLTTLLPITSNTHPSPPLPLLLLPLPPLLQSHTSRPRTYRLIPSPNDPLSPCSPRAQIRNSSSRKAGADCSRSRGAVHPLPKKAVKGRGAVGRRGVEKIPSGLYSRKRRGSIWGRRGGGCEPLLWRREGGCKGDGNFRHEGVYYYLELS